MEMSGDDDMTEMTEMVKIPEILTRDSRNIRVD